MNELITDGFGDSAAQTLPLIVRYADPAGARAQSLTGTTTTRSLDSIGGAAVSASKDELPELWKSLGPSANARALSRGVSRIWLDGKSTRCSTGAVPQIGAPAAWQAGYEGAGVGRADVRHSPSAASYHRRAGAERGTPDLQRPR